jgi:hypothetical protein
MESSGSMTAPLSRKCCFHWSCLGLNNGTKSPDGDTEAMFEPLYRLQTMHICEIGRTRLTAVLPANDVINFVRKRSVILMEQAVFAPEHRPLHNFCP